METAPSIEFQGMAPSDVVRATVLERIERLESRFGRVTACRVVIKSPGEHHHEGGLYEVNIHLALPNGKEVNVGRTPQADERHANIRFAVNDAFKRARRQLQDEVRLLQGATKFHEGQPIGTVTKLLDDHGFLESSDGREIYFHHNSVLDGGFAGLTIGRRVAFNEEAGEKGPQASTVRPLKKHGMHK